MATTCATSAVPFVRPEPRRSILWRITEQLVEGVAALRREIAIRRAIRDLSGASEAMLRDIGLSPGEIENAARNGRPRPRA